ncbi:MAG: hypothetical protein JXA11_09325 [Phycisphaerae bacterium]|nr:hypothetical protein [Phycisphaerae bacterium]
MNRFRFVVLSVLLAFALLGCQNEQPVDTTGVDPIAREILDAVARGDARSVYDRYFTAIYKQDVTPEEWKEIVTGYQAMFGNVLGVNRLRGGAKWIEGQFIDGQVVYGVTWEKGAGELILDVTQEDGWKVRQLRIESPQIDERVNELTTQPVE